MSDENKQPTEENDIGQNESEQQQFVIQKMYIKDLSFEAPNLPDLFNVEYKPQVKMEMNSKSRYLENNHFEVILSVTLSADIEEKTAFLAEVQQAGLFLIQGFNEQQVHQLVGAAAPEALYPYVRETVASLVGKSGFPAIQLAPVNFMGLYMESLKQEQEKVAGTNAASETLQ